MTFDHRTTDLRVEDLDRQIEQLRTERRLTAVSAGDARPGAIDRARRGVGRVLIAAGETLGGPEARLPAPRA